jgi:hypothetical protein
MNTRSWSGLALSTVVLLIVPFTAVDPDFAALQHRANASLEKLIQSASASP